MGSSGYFDKDRPRPARDCDDPRGPAMPTHEREARDRILMGQECEAEANQREQVAREVHRLEGAGYIRSAPGRETMPYAPGSPVRGNAARPGDHASITGLVDNLSSHLHDCRDAVQQLEQVLAPVLVNLPSNGGAGGELAKECSTGVPLAEALLSLIRMTRDIKAAVVSIGQRVAL